jgi:UDP-glucuronate 4-epimerase
VSQRFLVTGAYGCIGAWTVRQLVREGVEVIGVDAGSDDRRVRELLVEDELAAATFLQGDVSDSAQVEQLFDLEPTHVIHLAALQVPECRDNPVLGARVNVVGTVTLFAAAAHAGIATPVVYASSAAAFAAADASEGAPADPSGHPGTHYGVFKYANEGTARVFSVESGLSSIGLRPYVVYGAGRDRGVTSAPTAAMRAAAEGVGYAIPYSGRTEMQYAPDVAAAFIAAARAGFAGARNDGVGCRCRRGDRTRRSGDRGPDHCQRTSAAVSRGARFDGVRRCCRGIADYAPGHGRGGDDRSLPPVGPRSGRRRACGFSPVSSARVDFARFASGVARKARSCRAYDDAPRTSALSKTR